MKNRASEKFALPIELEESKIKPRSKIPSHANSGSSTSSGSKVVLGGSVGGSVASPEIDNPYD